MKVNNKLIEGSTDAEWKPTERKYYSFVMITKLPEAEKKRKQKQDTSSSLLLLLLHSVEKMSLLANERDK